VGQASLPVDDARASFARATSHEPDTYGRTNPSTEIVRNAGELEQKFNYILGNPWKRWPSLDRYAWVWPSD
jgi:hypothetical protein